MIEGPETWALLAISAVLVLLLLFRPELTRQRGGKILAFVGLFLLPALTAWAGFMRHLEISKSREFCLSCHVMHPYGKSLAVDDDEYLPALHYQNNWVQRDRACYTCHTNYTMYGDVKSKLRGMRHLWVQYFGSIPDTIHLYMPYRNRECLHCHGGARRFLATSAHTEGDTTLAALQSERLSCLTRGCHDTAHDVKNLNGVGFWKEPVP